MNFVIAMRRLVVVVVGGGSFNGKLLFIPLKERKGNSHLLRVSLYRVHGAAHCVDPSSPSLKPTWREGQAWGLNGLVYIAKEIIVLDLV